MHLHTAVSAWMWAFLWAWPDGVAYLAVDCRRCKAIEQR